MTATLILPSFFPQFRLSFVLSKLETESANMPEQVPPPFPQSNQAEFSPTKNYSSQAALALCRRHRLLSDQAGSSSVPALLKSDLPQICILYPSAFPAISPASHPWPFPVFSVPIPFTPARASPGKGSPERTAVPAGWLGTAFGTVRGWGIAAYLAAAGCVSLVYPHASVVSYPSQLRDLCSLSNLFKISIWM